MGARLRALTLLVLVLLVGAFVGSALDQWATTPEPAAPPDRGYPPPGERVRVEVLNGGGREGMARKATDRLRDRGFDVVYYGNAETFGRDSSVVLDRVGRRELARGVADALGIPSVVSEPDSNLYLDVSVVLGRAWEPAEPVSSEEVTAPAWWDPRRFFDFDDDRSRPGTRGKERERMTDPGTEGGDR